MSAHRNLRAPLDPTQNETHGVRSTPPRMAVPGQTTGEGHDLRFLDGVRSTSPTLAVPGQTAGEGLNANEGVHGTSPNSVALGQTTARNGTKRTNDDPHDVIQDLIHTAKVSGLDWMSTIPSRLRARLSKLTPTTAPADHGVPQGPIVLLLYAGPDNHASLETSIQKIAPWLTPYVLAMDICRDKRHDMLDANLYMHLLHKATQGDILGVTGGPNCRTWSVLTHRPQWDGSHGRPLRSRHEPHCWGKEDLTAEELQKVDDDSLLALRMMTIYDAARDAGHDPLFFLEHPADPETHGSGSTPRNCCSIWETDAMRNFISKHQLLMATFPQCGLGGQGGAKWTSACHRHLPGVRKLDDLRCSHQTHYPGTKTSGDLSRWPPGLNSALAKSIVNMLPNLRHWTNQSETDRPNDNIARPGQHAKKSIQVHIGHKSRPLRDGGGKPSPGRIHPAQRTHPLRTLGTLIALGTVANTMSLPPELHGPTQDMADGLAKDYPYGDAVRQKFVKIVSDFTSTTLRKADGQPFALETIHRLASMADDPDALFPLDCIEGLPLGVDETLPPTGHIWPSKSELTGVDQHEDYIGPPSSQPNYPSAAEHEDAIEATYIEDRDQGLASGPHTDAEAAALCGCRPDELCHGALAGKLEGRYLDKLRTIHDGTINEVNQWIKRNQHYRQPHQGCMTSPPA